MRDVEVVLFDFSGTLAEEVRLFGPSDDVPPSWRTTWEARFGEPGFADEWQRGEIGREALIEDLAERFAADAAAIRAHIRSRCEAVVFNPGIMKSVVSRSRRRRPQALVTINPDLFDDIVEHFELSTLFDVVVLSAREGTIDKIELCRIALERLGGRDLESALLIDDVAEYVDRFKDEGGLGYRFVDDATFVRDLDAGLLPLSLKA